MYQISQDIYLVGINIFQVLNFKLSSLNLLVLLLIFKCEKEFILVKHRKQWNWQISEALKVAEGWNFVRSSQVYGELFSQQKTAKWSYGGHKFKPSRQNFPHSEVRNNNKSPGNGITESVKSCNLYQKGRILWYSKMICNLNWCGHYNMSKYIFKKGLTLLVDFFL